MLSVRAAATQVITQILAAKGSLSSLLPPASAKIADNDRALLQELCFGTCRFYPQLQAVEQRQRRRVLRAAVAHMQPPCTHLHHVTGCGQVLQAWRRFCTDPTQWGISDWRLICSMCAKPASGWT